MNKEVRSGEREVDSRRTREEEVGDEGVGEEGGARDKWKRVETAWV